jgi:DNA mismatch repair protein MutS
MLFTTDKQTLEDLNIFGRHGENSVFGMFNRCATRGGAALMEEMFRSPLADSRQINARTGIIRYFAEHAADFPFTAAHFDAIEPYLANVDERTRLSEREVSLGRKIGQLLAPDAEQAMITRGITALATLWKELLAFAAQPVLAGAADWAADYRVLITIVNDPGFAELTVAAGSGRLPESRLVTLDSLLRFRHREQLQQLLRIIYRLDAFLAVARTAIDRQLSFAVAAPPERKVLKIQGLYHPAVRNAIANDVEMSAQEHVVFLTGANMAGKSTFMKSLSLALFLAHMGFPVPASFMEFTVLDGIYTTINLPDNLGMGASHFYAEVLRLKKIASELGQGKRLFVVFDELFRGTNVKDAYEATVAVVEAFATRRNSLFIISTHIIEAGAVLKQSIPHIRFLYLPTIMNGKTPMYTYTVEEGITADRHGMVIIQNEGILEILERGMKKKAAVPALNVTG